MIRCENLTKIFGDSVVLDNVSFSVSKGEIFSIVGPSGTGKSVTLKHLVGLFKPTSGKVFLQDEEVSSASGKKLEKIRERFGYLFQGGALLGWLSVAENVALPLKELTRLKEDEINRQVMDALDAVGLKDAADLFPAEISGGMQKRAGLARAIVRKCDIVLYDEPTSGLDPVTAITINNLIKRINKERGITSIVVTHDLANALLFSDRIMMIKDSKVVINATPDEFVASANKDVQEFLDAQFITEESYKRMKVEYEKKQ
jgi:phospholipid/cholesterol/gamma-HCH transport system ATP-binding protein